MKRSRQAAVLLVFLAICTCFATTARAKDPLVLRDPSTDLFEERLAERQRLRQEAWDSYVIDWPDEKPIVSEDTCGLAGRDYDEKTVIAFAQHDLTSEEVIEGLDALETVELADDKRGAIDENSVCHQFVIALTVREGHTVQEAIDELWECPVVEYADINRFYYADANGQVRRGEAGDTELHMTYRDLDEAELMQQKLRDGEITKQEWSKYYNKNVMMVYPGVKPELDPYQKPNRDYVSDELLVVPIDDATYEEVLAAVDAMQAVRIEQDERAKLSSRYLDDLLPDHFVVALNKGYTLKQGIDEIWECPLVAYVQYVYIYYTDPIDDGEYSSGSGTTVAYAESVPADDPDIAVQQWLSTVDARNAWDISTASGNVSVAVLDSGFDVTHEDLSSAFDMAHAYNAVTQTQDVTPLNDHGTHVAGIIGARANNGYGIAGVSYNATIVPIQVFYEDINNNIRSSTAILIEAYDHLMQQVQDGTLASLSVINMSLGHYGWDSLDDSLQAKVSKARNSLRILTVCSAGNGGNEATLYNASTQETAPHYPSDYEASVAVCATGSGNAHADFSDFNAQKDISAPGVGIYSTMCGEPGYGTMSGTSMAAPIVSGVAALLYAYDPLYTADEVEDILYTTATDLRGSFAAPDGTTTITYGAGLDKATGHGLVCASAAVEEALDRTLDASWERLYGGDRYETAAAVSAGTFQSAQNVVIACGTSFPDALSASSIAGALSAPILVVSHEATTLPAPVSAEIARLGATHATIVGGELSVTQAVENQLKALLGSANVERVYGDGRIGTCLAVAQRIGSAHSDTAIVANGFSYPDALSVAAFSYASVSPLFLTKEDGTLTQAEVDAINAAGYDKVLIVGGTLSVQNSVKTQLAATGRKFYRAWGENRYETCAAVARWALGDVYAASFQPTVQLSADYVCLVRGADFADTFGAASAAGSQGGTLLLCHDSTAGRVPATVLYSHASEVVEGRAAGGTLSVPTAVLRDYMLAAS